MLSFENTRIAFSDKSTAQLKKAYWLFWMVKNPLLVKIGAGLLSLANRLHIPLNWAMRNTVFNHFCGGETLEKSQKSIEILGQKNIKAVLDYAAEGNEIESEYDQAKDRIIATIEMARDNPNIGFAVFKFTGIARFKLLEKVSMHSPLTMAEQQEYTRIKERADLICDRAYQIGIPVMIDAEESWIQSAIDAMVEELMEKYNHKKPVVYHTVQMYCTDKLFYLKHLTKVSKQKNIIPGFKIVRGAYMEKERKRAQKNKYASPIQPDKASTDAAFNDALKFCISNIDQLSVCIGSHNEESCLEAAYLMDLNELEVNHERVYFSQLKGMSDHISYNLASNGYNVSKYVPYGPLKLAMPYLIRRAQENTSVAGQTSRELFLIRKELKRRKKENQPMD